MKTAIVNIIGLRGILQRIIYNSMIFWRRLLGKAISPNTSHLSFTEKKKFRYNGKDRKYRHEIPKKKYDNVVGSDDRCPYNEDSRNNRNSPPARQPTPTVNVIAGGITSGGDTVKQR
jgi:hypothetical protein